MKRQRERRYRAKPAFRQTVAEMGRRADWLAARIGVSPSYLSKVFAGDRRLSEAQAWKAAGLLDADVFLLFESPDGNAPVPVRMPDAEAIPA